MWDVADDVCLFGRKTREIRRIFDVCWWLNVDKAVHLVVRECPWGSGVGCVAPSIWLLLGKNCCQGCLSVCQRNIWQGSKLGNIVKALCMKVI